MSGPLANPVFRRLFAAQSVALVGTGLSTVALGLFAYQLAGPDAGRVLGTALALKMVAYVGIALLVGAIAHRLPRRRLLVGLDLARALLIGALPWVTELWQVYALIFLLNACSAGFTPTFQATIPDILTDERGYTRALSLSRLAYDLENLLSPTLAALALLVMSYHGLFTLNAMAFLISAALVVSVVLPKPGLPNRAANLREELTYGLRVFLATPRLRALLALYSAVSVAGAMIIVNSVVIVRDRLGGSEFETALAFIAAGVGSIVIALALPRLLDRTHDRPFLWSGGGLITLGLWLGAADPSFIALLAIWCMLGAGTSLIQTPAGRLIRRSCHSGDRPAVFAAQFALSHACWLVAYPLVGWLGSTAGMSTTFFATGGIAGVATVLSIALWRGVPAGPLTHEHPALEHEHPHVHDEHHQHTHEGWEGPEPHIHPHHHTPLSHAHDYVIDDHHPRWPRPARF